MNALMFFTLTIGDWIDKTFYGFDVWVYKIFGAMQNGFLTWVAKAFTALGDENFVIPVAVLDLVLCFFKKTRKYGLALVFAIMIGTLVTNIVVKPMVLRIRPYNTLQGTPIAEQYAKWYAGAGGFSESDYSFPSGHTTAAFEIAIAMFLCFRSRAKELKAAGEKTVMGKLAWIFPVIAICVMGSRIYLMVHYPTDVIGGLLVGTVAGICGYFIAKVLCKLFEKVSFLDKIDVERISKKGFNPKAVTVCLCVVLVGFFCLSFIPALSEGAGHEQLCAYSGAEYDNVAGDYDCLNAARVDDEKYYAFDGNDDGIPDEYCKIHWKALHGDETEDQE